MVGSFLNWESACDLGSIYENAPCKVKIRRVIVAEKENHPVQLLRPVIHGATDAVVPTVRRTGESQVCYGSAKL
jgi:hypothetical protein